MSQSQTEINKLSSINRNYTKTKRFLYFWELAALFCILLVSSGCTFPGNKDSPSEEEVEELPVIEAMGAKVASKTLNMSIRQQALLMSA